MTIPNKYDIETEHGLDEFGPQKNLYIEFTCYWNVTAGEPIVRYYPDGSGYPGSPPEAELLEVHVTEVEGEDDDVRQSAEACDDFLGQLEKAIREEVEKDPKGTYHQAAFEATADRDEGQKDAAADDAYERRRLGE